MRWQRAGKRSIDGALEENTRGRFPGKRVSFVNLTRAPAVLQYGAYLCHTHMQKRTYIKASWFAEFIFDALIKVQDLDEWNCILKTFLGSLPYSGRICRKEVIDYIRNGYIT
jgi:hypothetical protein